jgi:hypothetical protein
VVAAGTRLRRRAALILACWVGVHGTGAARAAAGALDPVLSGLEWGETSEALKRHFGKRALALVPPIEFGDAYVDVALRDVALGGYDYVVYFQMDRTSHGLRRVMYERQRHGANQKVFDAAVKAIEAQGGKPKSCADKARPGNGYQAMREYVWRSGGRRVRAIFRDTTLEAENGCQEIGFLPCGLEGHLFIVVDPENAPESDCG